MSDPRFIQLTNWLTQLLNENVSPILISGDASFRRYFRVKHQGNTFIAVDSPPELIDIKPFIEISLAYQKRGLVVPKVINSDRTQGFMLLTDLGDTQLLSVLKDNNIEHYYNKALSLLHDVAQVTRTETTALPIYDKTFVLGELGIFNEWLIKRHLNLSFEANQTMLDKAFSTLIENALTQPQVGMHRDYHSRNLMLDGQDISIIDFQDAVIGPVTYDAVSLLRDCYIRWPDEVVEKLMAQHYQASIERQLLSAKITLAQYRRWFDLMGLQRHIKAAGIFARLNYRDNKPAYMADIPLTLSYIVDISAKYPELEDFGHWVKQVVTPAYIASISGELT